MSNPGYRWDLEDRVKLYARGVEWHGAGVDIPDSVDPRAWLRTENQGPMGSCQGHDLSTGMEFIYHGIRGEVIQFSPMWCYLMTQKLDGLFGRDVGSTISGGVEVAMKDGVCTEEVFPYPEPVRYSTHIPDHAAENAANYKAGRYSPIRSFKDAVEWIGSGQGFISAGVRFPFRNRDGLVTSWRPTGNGGHAMAFCGYADFSGHGRCLIWFNSHGVRSGRSGEYIVTKRAFEEMLRDRRTVAIGVSDMPTVKPREINFLKNPLTKDPELWFDK